MSEVGDEQDRIDALIAAIKTGDPVQIQRGQAQEQQQEQQEQQQQEQQQQEQQQQEQHPDLMDLPVKRSELIQAMHVIQAVLLSHSTHDAARLAADEDRIRETGARAVEQTLEIGALARDLITGWKEEDVRKT